MDLREAIEDTLDIARRTASTDMYDCWGPTNADRARWAREAWAAHQYARDGAVLTSFDVPADHQIADAICNLLHLADHTKDCDPLTVLDSAFGNYAAEAMHPLQCDECRLNTEANAAALAALIGIRVLLPTDELGTVNDARIDYLQGDQWSVVLDGSGKVVWQRAENCRVIKANSSES
jgi:hypothetical protein